MSSGKLVITAVGDTTCSEDAKKTFENIAKLSPSLNLFLGDSSYNEESAKCFTDIISQNNLKATTMITLGNHDEKEEHAEKVKEELIEFFGLPSDILLTKIIGNVYIISMNSQDRDWNLKGEKQYNWVVGKLDEAKKLRDEEKKIDWIFVLIHKPLYTLKASHTPERKARDLYQPLFDRYQVDFVLHGHNHNQQRTKPISYGGLDSKPVITSDAIDKYDFSTHHGQIYVVSGAGGRKFHEFEEDNNKWTVFAQDDTFGYHILTVEGKNVVVKAQSNSGKVLEEFSVTK